jgi:hypothetical protein
MLQGRNGTGMNITASGVLESSAPGILIRFKVYGSYKILA